MRKVEQTIKIGDLIADVEEVIDTWKSNGEFSMYDFLTHNKATPRIASQITKYYQPLSAELEEVTSSIADAQLREGYKSYSKRDLTKYATFVKQLVVEAERYSNQSKKARKPRRTVKSRESKLKAFKFKLEYTELKIKSIDPYSIFGAIEIWLFETKQKRLTVLRSTRGMDVKGTSIINFDPKTSFSKKIGNRTQEIVDVIISGTKFQSKNKFEDASTNAIEATGRVNKETVLLRSWF